MRRLLAAAVLCAAATGARAADFTLRVPVTITNVPSATQVKVDCYVSKIAVGGVSPAAAENIVGRNYAFQPVAGGAYSGPPVVVSVNATGIIPPSAARSYGCSLTLYGRATTGVDYAAQPGNLAAVVNTATGQTITEVVATVSGPITP